MIPSKRIGERMVALFLLGALLFNPPLLIVFDVGAGVTLLGIPVLFLYVFVSWAGIILLMAVAIYRRDKVMNFGGHQETLLDGRD